MALRSASRVAAKRQWSFPSKGRTRRLSINGAARVGRVHARLLRLAFRARFHDKVPDYCRGHRAYLGDAEGCLLQ